MNNKKEIWKDIPGYEGIYQVSDMGRVKSIVFGRWKKNKETILKQREKPNKHVYVELSKGKKRKCFFIKNLVSETFLPEILDVHYISHKNGIKNDNRATNLEFINDSTDLDNEIWVPVIGFKGYKISNFGRVKSLNKQRNNYKDTIVKQYKDRNGYIRVHLFKENKNKEISLHRLVALNFIPNKDNKPQVNHKDGIKTNNSVDNLEWMTAKENMIHAFENKINKNFGEKHYYSKLTEENVLEIRSPGASTSKLAKKFGVSKRCIMQIKDRTWWKHVK